MAIGQTLDTIPFVVDSKDEKPMVYVALFIAKTRDLFEKKSKNGFFTTYYGRI